jgi:GMP synthase (glutamine-hydrolysing)
MTDSSNLALDKKNLDTILVLDFGSQYTQLIARRIRELDVFSEILPWDISKEKIVALNPKGIILSGGPDSVTEANTPRIPEIVFELDIPILGICYGMQTLAEQFGGQVTPSKVKEFGHAAITIEQSSVLFDGFSPGSSIDVWMSHGDHVSTLPDQFNLIASTPSAPIAAMEHSQKPIYALQFHPEVTHTKEGNTVLENFAFKICHC